MRGFFQRVGYTLQQFMRGRYGYDALSKVLLISAVIFSFLSCFPDLQLLYLASFILLVFSVYRSLSKNFEKRRAELNAYLRISGKIKGGLETKKKQWRERKTHRYFKCKSCKTTLRVPKNKGKIKIRCPKCGSELIRKT